MGMPNLLFPALKLTHYRPAVTRVGDIDRGQFVALNVGWPYYADKQALAT
jgi:hypothetical protein